MSFEFLCLYWWLLVSVIGGLFVFTMFIQGAQAQLWALGKNKEERDLLINVMGRKWELNFTSLVMFGGALFAAFPLFYSVSFGGAYYVWIAILFCFIIQAVSYEYRSKPNNVFGPKFYETLLFINGVFGTFLLGVALATLYSGGNFIVDEYNLSRWSNNYYGLEALLNVFNVVFGLMLVVLAKLQALYYFSNIIEHKAILDRIYKRIKRCAVVFLVLFLYVAYIIFTQDGYKAIDGKIIVEKMRILNTFLNHPIVLIAFLIGVLLVVYAMYISIFKKSSKAVWFNGFGVVIVVTTLLFSLGLDNGVIYPSLSDLQSSLTLAKASGSKYTLTVMSYVSLLVPVVLGYIYIVWKAMDKNKVTLEEIQNDPHHY